MLILIFNHRHPLPLILNKPHPQFFLIKNILNLRKKFSDIYCAKDWHEISRYSQMTAECQPLNFGKIGLARQSSLLKVYSSCMRTVRLKTCECTVNWGEWAGGGGYPYLTRNFSSVRITIYSAPTCPPPVVGTLNRAFLLPITPSRGSMTDDWGRFIVGCSHSKFGAR